MIKKTLLALAVMILPSIAFANDMLTGDFYAGVGVADDSATDGALQVFGGYEQTFSEHLYGALEVGLQTGDGVAGVYTNRMHVDAKAGAFVSPELAAYAILGWGGTSDTKGIRYGAGLKYDMFEKYFMGAEFVHQEFTNVSTDTFGVRAGMRF